MMAVAQDLPDLEARAQYDARRTRSSSPATARALTTLTGNEKRILVESDEIAPSLKQAVVAIEDERFYEHRGIDFLGIARALQQDIISGGAVQGASTITQQFVKNALEAQGSRTVLQKLREAALAYQIERQWSKDKILTNYLNNIYFGNGAYGIEAAARTYFGTAHPGCGEPGDRCAAVLEPEESAMLAALISSPTAYDPRTNPEAAQAQRNVVLEKMREQGVLEISDEDFQALLDSPVPTQGGHPAAHGGLEGTVLHRLAAPADRRQVRRRPGVRWRPGDQVDARLRPSAGRRAGRLRQPLGPRPDLRGRRDRQRQRRGARDGRRPGLRREPVQPGHQRSAPARILVQAVHARHRAAGGALARRGLRIGAPAAPVQGDGPTKNGKKKEVTDYFKVNNYDDNYLGSASIATATTYSDNSVYAQLGLEVGINDIVKTAHELGITSRLDDNPAIILGGLKRGVTPLEMAYAYNTLANGGARISGTEASQGNGKGPVAIDKVVDQDDELVPDTLGGSGENEKVSDQVIDPSVAQTATDILHTVVTSGTGERAQVGDDYIWGKTGTTDNNADAWFVGANEDITVAVWVGYPDGATPMDDRVRRPPGRRRHDPGADLERRRHRLGRPAGIARGRGRRRRRDDDLDRHLRRPDDDGGADDHRRRR